MAGQTESKGETSTSAVPAARSSSTTPQSGAASGLGGVEDLVKAVSILTGQVTDLAHVVGDMKARTPAPTPTGQTLSEDQARAVLAYRLVRNGLGSYGGNGDGFDRAWLDVTLERESGSWVLHFDDLPKATLTVRPYLRTSEGDKAIMPITPRPCADGSAVATLPEQYQQDPVVVLVEALDGSTSPIAAGVPSVLPAAPNPT